MRLFSRSSRGPIRGATALGAFLLATLVLAGWLGFQAIDAAGSHRRTAEAVLRDYAGISAVELTRVAQANLDEVLDEIFDPISRRVRFGNIPSPALVAADIDDAMRDQGCRCPTFLDPIAVFRIDPPAGTLTVLPDTLSQGTLDRIYTAVRPLRPSRGRSEHGLLLRDFPGSPEEVIAIGYLVSEDLNGMVEPTFGFVVAGAALGELFEEWYGDRHLLPEPIAANQPNDSILFVMVEDPLGRTIFASPTAYPTELSVTSELGPEFGDLRIRAAVRPDAASQLIIGGLPNSRLPLLAALLLLTLGIGVAAVIQLRREQGFQQLREDFVSGVSHELRTPLAQIRMFAELQEAGKLAPGEDQRRAVSVIHRESRRLSHLVENILQFSSLRRTQGRTLPRDRLDLAEAIEEGIDAVQPLLEERGARLEVTALPGLMVQANRDAITRIVVNLLDNAVKYGPRAQTIRIGVEQAPGHARLTVSDEGPGVPAADRGLIWKSYRRLDRDVKARVPGTGIGLSVVAELAALHEGRSWVEDAAGGGARFIIDFPLALAGQAPGLPAPALAEAPV